MKGRGDSPVNSAAGRDSAPGNGSEDTEELCHCVTDTVSLCHLLSGVAPNLGQRGTTEPTLPTPCPC